MEGGRLRPPPWALERVPGVLSQGADPLIERLHGGSVNDVWRVRSEAGEFVVRLNGADWRRPGVDRHREFMLHRAASDAGVAPALVAAEPEREGLLISAFEAGRSWCGSDYSNVRSLHRLGERLQVLHSLPVPDVAGFDPRSIAQSYLAAIRRHDAAAEPPAQVLRRLYSACDEMAQVPGDPCIAHGDLTQGNLLEGSRLWLLDWEYAQRGDAYMDVACVIAYYPDSAGMAAELLSAAGLRADRTILAPRVYVYRALSWLWHLARGESTPPPDA